MNQSKLEVVTRSRQKGRDNVRARVTICFGFTSDWLKNWQEIFKPITERSNAKPKQFAQLRTALADKTGSPARWPSK